MTNAVIGYRNRIDEGGALSGGSWLSAFPLNNLKNRTLGRVARSASAAAADTRFDLQLGDPRSTGLVALINHNLRLSARIRIRGTNEGPGTNLLLKSEQIDAANWNKSLVTVTANATIAPDGAATADKIIETAAAGAHAFSMAAGKAAVTITETGSIFLKAAERSFARLRLSGSPGGSYIDLVFNLSTGQVVGSPTTVGTDGLFVGSSITATPNGFWRVGLSARFNATPTSVTLTVILQPDATASSYIGVAGSGLFAWGAQLEETWSATSYIPTDATSANRVAGFMDAWQSYAYDTGSVPVWPTGQTEDTIAGITPVFLHLLPAAVAVRWWRFEIDDPYNSYAEIGRLFIGDAWQPAVNMLYGASLGWEDNSEIQEALSGAEYFTAKRPYRVARFTTAHMSINEGMSRAYDVQRRSGVSKEVMFMWAADDTTYLVERSFYGRLRQLSPIEYPYPDNTRTVWEIKEVTP